MTFKSVGLSVSSNKPPISTPPNAIAYSTGLVKQKDMAKAGFTSGFISLIIGYIALIAFCKLGIL